MLRGPIIVILSLLLGALAIRPAWAEEGPPLKVSLTASTPTTPENDSLRELFSHLLETLQSQRTGFPYTEVDLRSVSYGTPPEMIAEGALISLPPLKYVTCQRALGERQLIPLAIVRKADEAEPYYSAYFVSRSKSTITDIRSPAIRRLVLVDKNSASGYVAPLYKLYEARVLKAPTEQAAREKGWEVLLAGTHTEALARVAMDDSALGGVGQTSSHGKNVDPRIRVVLRYYRLPQDVLAVSADLQPYADSITSWFLDLMATDPSGRFINPDAKILANSSARITGIDAIGMEHINSLAELGNMEAAVASGQLDVDLNSMGKIRLGDFIGLLGRLSLTTIFSALSVATAGLGVAFTAGKWWGRFAADRTSRAKHPDGE